MLDDEVELDPQRACVAVDGDAFAAKHAANARAGRETDDAVAAERRLGDDLGDRLPRDRQSPVFQVQREFVGHGGPLDRIRPDLVARAGRILEAMGISAVLAGALVTLVSSGPGGTGRLEHVAPATLAVRDSVRAPDASFGLAWARRGSRIAFVAKPRATGQPVRIVDARTLRTVRVIQVGDRDVCGLTYDGASLVALVADHQPCYWSGGHFSLLRVMTGATVRVPALGSVFPTNLAFGDGKAFVARVGGGVDAVDLRTGSTTRHRPRRTLSKGQGIVAARWLGGHLLAAGPAVVDVRSWRARTLDPTARGVAPAGGAGLVAYGPRGAAVYTRTGVLRFRVLRGVAVGSVHVVGRYLYAAEDSTADIVDLRTRREDLAAADASIVWSLFAE
jgi:hypothetical protein